MHVSRHSSSDNKLCAKSRLPRTPKRTNKDLDNGVSPLPDPPVAELATTEDVGWSVGTETAVSAEDAVMASGVLILFGDAVTCSRKSSDCEKRINVLNDGSGGKPVAEDAADKMLVMAGVGHENPVPIPDSDVVNAGSVRVFVKVVYVVSVVHNTETGMSPRS